MVLIAILIFFVFPVSLVVFHVFTRRFINPYKLIFVFGKKGSGKSTLLTRYALEYQRRGWAVYSTEPIPGTYQFRPEQFGFIRFPPQSCIIIDEVGMIWDNRGFKSFKPEVRDYFKLQRHYRNVIVLASQTFDVDKKIRDLADEMYLVEKRWRIFSYAKKILRRTVLIEASGESPSRIDENLEYDSLLLFWAGSRKLTFIPRYARYFDSFQVPGLPDADCARLPLHIPVRRGRLGCIYRRVVERGKLFRFWRRSTK